MLKKKARNHLCSKNYCFTILYKGNKKLYVHAIIAIIAKKKKKEKVKMELF